MRDLVSEIYDEVFIFIIVYYLFWNVNWRIITFQHCDGFCRTPVWIGHKHICVPILLNLPPTSFLILSWEGGKIWKSSIETDTLLYVK